MSDDRAKLAQSQAALAAALAGRADAPVGFSADQIELARKGLERKRLATLRRAMPRMTDEMGEELEKHWQAHVLVGSVTEDPTADACAFARYLLDRNLFPKSAMAELVYAELRSGRRMVVHVRPVLSIGVRLFGRHVVRVIGL